MSVAVDAGRNVLVLGNTGKIGSALEEEFGPAYRVSGKNSRDFNVADLPRTERLIRDCRPDVVLNAVVFGGVDPCEGDPLRAFQVNAFFPKRLAELSNEMNFLLVHFSSDGVFDGESRTPYRESDAPWPINVYGLTKFGGDCFVRSVARRYYIIRISVLFGKSAKRTQFVERMLERIQREPGGVRIADDLVCSPCFSRDVAWRVRQVIEEERPFGLYHVANAGQASLYELMCAAVENLKLDAKIGRASHGDFAGVGRKTVFTPLVSEKLPPLRSWQEALRSTAENLLAGEKGIMSDKYLMDGTKLPWHADRVRDWLDGKRIAPIHIDVGLGKGCNIRCQYCFGALQGNRYRASSAVHFPREPLLRYMRDAGAAGVRSMGLIGEAEPLLNPHVYDAIVEGAKAGVDMALGTNGILLDTGAPGHHGLGAPALGSVQHQRRLAGILPAGP